MRNITSGVLAGVAGALAMGATMVLGRKAGFLHQTLDEDSEEWLDRNFDARRHLGDAGTTDGAACVTSRTSGSTDPVSVRLAASRYLMR